MPALQALTTALVFTLPRQASAPGASSDRRVLWPLALSGDKPLLVVDIAVLQGLGLLRTLLQALHTWARCGLACDVVVVSHEAHSYHMPLQQALLALRERHGAELRTLPGGTVVGLHVHRSQDLSAPQLATLAGLARVRLSADGRPLHVHVLAWLAWHRASRQPVVSGAARWLGAAPTRVPAVRTGHVPPAPQGRFATDDGQFSFHTSAQCRPTRPWVNVLANPGFGALVSEAGGGHTWALNSRLHQLTPWANDPVADLPGEWLVLQDRRSQAVWALSPSAWGDPSLVYEVTHGLGTTRIAHRRGDLGVVVVWCVDAHTAVKHVRIELTNHGTTRQHLRLLGMVEWQMGEHRRDRATTHTALAPRAPTEPGTQPATVLLCTQVEAAAGFDQHTAFWAMAAPALPHTSEPDGPDWTCDRREFFDPQCRFSFNLSLLNFHLAPNDAYKILDFKGDSACAQRFAAQTAAPLFWE